MCDSAQIVCRSWHTSHYVLNREDGQLWGIHAIYHDSVMKMKILSTRSKRAVGSDNYTKGVLHWYFMECCKIVLGVSFKKSQDINFQIISKV